MADTQEPQLPVAQEEAPSDSERVTDALKADLDPLMAAAVDAGDEGEVIRLKKRWEDALIDEIERVRKKRDDAFDYLEEAKKTYPAGSREIIDAETTFEQGQLEYKQIQEFVGNMEQYYEETRASARTSADTIMVEKIQKLGTQFESEIAATTDAVAKRAVCDKYESLLNAIAV